MCVVEYIENVHIQCEILKKIDEAECIVEDCMWKVFSTGSVIPFISDFKLTYEGTEIIAFPVKKNKII